MYPLGRVLGNSDDTEGESSKKDCPYCGTFKMRRGLEGLLEGTGYCGARIELLRAMTACLKGMG